MPAGELASILTHLDRNEISGKTAKAILSMVFDGDKRSVPSIIEMEDLAIQHLAPEYYHAAAQALVDEHADMANKVRQGQLGKLQWFVGQLMRQEAGRADAQKAREAFESVLGVEDAPKSSK